MRIAYVTIHIEPKIIQGGVGSKINSQISIWRSMGHAVTLFMLTPEPISSMPDASQFVFHPPQKSLPGIKFVLREIARSNALARLISQVRQYQPDVIYFRFGLFTVPLQRLFNVAPVVLEVNSNDYAEYRSRGLFFYWLNRITRHITFSCCAGWIASSFELANLPENRGYGKPVCVVSNGIELDRYQPLPPPRNESPALALVGSPGMSWHGVDKLLPLAERYPDLQIHIVGYHREDLQGTIPANVHLHGYLNREHVRKVLAGVDVVFGTLALYRKKMEEASPLKIREALVYGIPVILAYHDTDLADIDSDLFLFLPNTETNVLDHAEAIRDFAYRVRGKRVDQGLVAERISQQHKEETRLKFFETMRGSERGRA
ncbi:MAG TPA: glycosyltransferase [Anaerolineales bacterium]|nr:glycosyltransferase [Anaerolineales bacterium]